MQRPNILIIYTDQQRWDCLGANGNSDILTPNLDRLAKESANFDHCFAQNPVCMPSRVSFLTGQYPSTLGITHMGVPVPQDTLTLPRMLKPWGYTSANIGKLHFIPHANRDHKKQHPDYGFDHVEISDEPGCYEDAYRAWVRRKAPDQLDKISYGLSPAAETWQKTMYTEDGINHPKERCPMKAIPFPGRDDVTHSAFVAEQTQEWIKQHHKQPFLCIAGFYSPHDPWIAPQKFLDLYDPKKLKLLTKLPTGNPQITEKVLRSVQHGYYAMISEVDHYVGQIVKTLEDLKLKDNTIIVFTSDHGEWLGKHGKFGKSFPGDDPVSRVPMIFHKPKSITTIPTPSKGKNIERVVESLDVVPTLLECAGIQVPPHLQGQSLLTSKDSKCALMEGSGWKNLRTENFRYIVRTNGEEFLYDISKDPYEKKNVAKDSKYTKALAEHRHLLLQKLLSMERPKDRAWSY